MKRTLVKGILALSMIGSYPVYAEAPSKEPSSMAQWFVALSLGGHFPAGDGPITVDNGVGFPPPNNVDSYSIQEGSNTTVALAFGRAWKREAAFIPVYSLGFWYQHFFTTDIGGTITQYSSPQFTNYNYHWDMYNDLFLLTGKLDLYRMGKVAPFIGAGVGFSRNRTENYNETALPNITPRISPFFSNQTNNKLAYNLSAGVDYFFAPQWQASLFYVYQDLGSQSSGSGTAAWATSALQLNAYTTSEVLVSIQFLWS